MSKSIQISQGILEIQNRLNEMTTSATIINNEYVISSCSILQSYFNDEIIIENLIKNSLLLIYQQNIIKIFDNFKFNIILENHKKLLIKKKLFLLCIYKSDNIEKFFINLSENYNSNLNKILAKSSFCIFKIIESNSSEETQSLSLLELELEETIKYDMKKFLQSIHIILSLKKYNNKNIQKLDDIFIVSTPFGITKFFNTIHKSSIANIFGENQTLFMLTNTLQTGCEGAPVFNKQMQLIGLIISTCFESGSIKKYEITLSANFSYCLFDGIFREFNKHTTNFVTFKTSNFQNSLPKLLVPTIKFPFEKYNVMIINDENQGSGVFVDILNKKFILTCSHCIRNINKPIICYYNEGKFNGNLLWKNEYYQKSYDLAILNVPDYINNDNFTKITNKKLKNGDLVYNSGFSIINTTNNYINSNGIKHNPDIFIGNIIKLTKNEIIFNGKQLNGFSGGPLFDRIGYLIGITVKNLIYNEEKIFNDFNFAVSLYNIKDILEMFVINNDVNILKESITSAKCKL